MRSIVDKPEIEYIGGRPYPKVSPKRRHSAVQLAMAEVLRRCAGGRGFVGTEWRFHLTPDTTLVPDTSYVSYERLRPLTDDEADEPAFAPEIAVEVRSPSDRQSLIDEKTRQYLSHGSYLVLNVDPATRSLISHTNDAPSRAWARGETFSCDAVPWLRFDIEDAFAGVDIPR